jgi:hypothetical protein
VREEGVVDGDVPAVSLGSWEVLVRWHPVGQFRSDRLEVTGAAELFGTDALRHRTEKLGDDALFRPGDQDSFDTGTGPGA